MNNAINQKSQDLFFKIRIPNANRILIQSIRDLRKTLYLDKFDKINQISVKMSQSTISPNKASLNSSLLTFKIQ